MAAGWEATAGKIGPPGPRRCVSDLAARWARLRRHDGRGGAGHGAESQAAHGWHGPTQRLEATAGGLKRPPVTYRAWVSQCPAARWRLGGGPGGRWQPDRSTSSWRWVGGNGTGRLGGGGGCGGGGGAPAGTTSAKPPGCYYKP